MVTLKPFVSAALLAILAAQNGLPLMLEHAHPVGLNLQHNSQRIAVQPTVSLPGPAALVAVTPHIHLVWFGFEFTLLPPLSAPSETDAPPAASISLVRLADDSLLASNPTSEFSVVFVETATSSELSPSASRAQPTIPSGRLLCDKARHERSGVQLN
jgi:hypothetical protein